MEIARIFRLLRSHLAAFALAFLARVLSALEKKLLAAITATRTARERIEKKLLAARNE